MWHLHAVEYHEAMKSNTGVHEVTHNVLRDGASGEKKQGAKRCPWYATT